MRWSGLKGLHAGNFSTDVNKRVSEHVRVREFFLTYNSRNKHMRPRTRGACVRSGKHVCAGKNRRETHATPTAARGRSTLIPES